MKLPQLRERACQWELPVDDERWVVDTCILACQGALAVHTKKPEGEERIVRGPKVVEFKLDDGDIKAAKTILRLGRKALDTYGCEAMTLIIVGRETWVGGVARNTRARERLLGALAAHSMQVGKDIFKDIDDLSPLPADDEDDPEE